MGKISVIRQKLFQIATRESKIHSYPEVIRPHAVCPIEPEKIFRPQEQQKHRHILELGCGWGDFLYNWLECYPDDDYLTFEVKASRIQYALRKMRKHLPKSHLRILAINFNWFLEELLPPHSFDWIIINFPDPWPKRRHWKHRLVQKNFDIRMAQLLRNDALLYFATDYGPYARRLLFLMRQSPFFSPVYAWPYYVRQRPQGMPGTYFENLALQQKKRPYYTCWQYCPPN